MREAASQVLVHRGSEPAGLKKTLLISILAHLLVLMLLALNPNGWLGAAAVEPNEVVMSIRLGGPDGPGQGGLTPIGGRPIQEVIPLPEARRPQWIQPPTPTSPKMVIPTDEARRRPEPETDVETAPDEARGRKLTAGSDLRDGTAMADTGSQGIGLGLSTGGLGGDGGEISVGDFCCPEYLATMIELLRRRWDPNQQVPGHVVIHFTIRRNGAIEDVGVQRGSGYVALDLSAQRAVLLTRQLPPLPSAFTDDSLTVRLTFEYRR